MKVFRTLTLVVSYTVAGCAATHMSPSTALAPANGGPLQPADRGAPTRSVKRDDDPYRNALYVLWRHINTIEIFANSDYHELGKITDGLSGAVAESMDQYDNLYVANLTGGDVTEYALGSTFPLFTYNADMLHPEAVTVDRHGDVYEVDLNGYVNQYLQRSNSVAKACRAPAEASVATAVAVDAGGDVFVSYHSTGSGGGLFEYEGGLSKCEPKHLSAMGSANTFGLAVDANNDLIALGYPDSHGAFVIDPPYSTITRTIGKDWFYGLSLTKDNKLLFAAHGDDVIVFDYQTGENTKVLGGYYGIFGATSVVDAPNAVY